MNRNQICTTALGALAYALCMGARAATSNGVTATLTTDKHSLGNSDDVIVNVTITNTSSSPQYARNWHIPFGEIEESRFHVTGDGVPAPYLGAHYKRQAPSAADYYLLKPDASHRMTNFTSFKDAFATKPVTVHCGCKKTYYAYVHPTQPQFLRARYFGLRR